MAHFVRDVRQMREGFSYLILEELNSQSAQKKADLRHSIYNILNISHRDIQHILDSEGGGHSSLNLIVDWTGVEELATKFFYLSKGEREAIGGFYQRTSPGESASFELLEKFCQGLRNMSDTERNRLESYLNIRGQVNAYVTQSDDFVEGYVLEELPDDIVPADLIKVEYTGPERYFVEYVKDWGRAFGTKLCHPRDYVVVRKAPIGAPKNIGQTQTFHAPSGEHTEGEVLEELPEDFVLL